jgi:hypothetical protein
MRVMRGLTLLLIGQFLGSCAGVYQSIVKQNREAILARAPFDLNCPKEQIDLTNLGNPRNEATYKESQTAGWVIDIASSDSGPSK